MFELLLPLCSIAVQYPYTLSMTLAKFASALAVTLSSGYAPEVVRSGNSALQQEEARTAAAEQRAVEEERGRAEARQQALPQRYRDALESLRGPGAADLEAVSVSSCDLTDGELSELHSLLAAAPGLRSLDLSGNRLTNGALQPLAAALAAGLVYYTATATPEIARELHELLQSRAQDDVTGEIGRVLTAYYKTPDATLSTEGWPTETREEYYVRLENAQQQSAKKAGFPIRSKSDGKRKSRKGDGEGATTRSAA